MEKFRFNDDSKLKATYAKLTKYRSLECLSSKVMVDYMRRLYEKTRESPKRQKPDTAPGIRGVQHQACTMTQCAIGMHIHMKQLPKTLRRIEPEYYRDTGVTLARETFRR